MLKTTRSLIRYLQSSGQRTSTHIPTLKEFMQASTISVTPSELHSTSSPTFHIETYGCQMNENDSQIIRSVLSKEYRQSPKSDADIVLINTCAIREAAQEKIYHRIKQLKKTKVVGILGCMAERLKQKMFQNGVQIVCGPDAYRDLPKLVESALAKENSINVQLSVEQTYADIAPMRKNPESPSAFLSIMRGCNNMCSFCIVPFVRGRERSRQIETILREISDLESQGVKEVTFLGQNVNSYHDISQSSFKSDHQNSEGFSETFKLRNLPGYRFQHLLQKAAQSFPNIQFRFTSPHPKDFPEKLLQTIATHNNICNNIHLPAQSGNTQMLFRMRRNHSRQSYLKLVERIRSTIPNVGLTTDLMCGFCGETQKEFEDTLSLLDIVRYDHAFLFAYSMREKTHAHRKYVDDVPNEVKKQRLKKMVDLFDSTLHETFKKQMGKRHLILIEKPSKRDSNIWMGRTDNFKKGYVSAKQVLPLLSKGQVIGNRTSKVGDFVIARVVQTKARMLRCENIAIASTLQDYYNYTEAVDKIEERHGIEKQCGKVIH